MRQHKLALCQEHYLEWFIQQTDRAIRKYQMFAPEARLLVAVSGGKDSLSLWDVLWRLGYAADGIYIQLGIEDQQYSVESGKYAEQFAAERQLKLHTINTKEKYGKSVVQFSRGSTKNGARPCSQCGLIKRYIMNQTALENGYTVLVTGHNLDDEVAVLLGNTLRWDTDLLPRQAPVLPQSEGFVRKAKPFCRFYERETAAYALLQGIDYIYDECPYAQGSKSIFYKELLNQLEDQITGSKLAFYQNFLNAKNYKFFTSKEEENAQIQKCKRCGQPTTRDLCAFCRLTSIETTV